MYSKPTFLFPYIPILFCLFAFISSCDKPKTSAVGANGNWEHYLGHPTSNQYSNLDQINKKNVAQLEVAWTFDTQDSANYQVNNLIVDGVLFTATPRSRVMALNAATGEHIWTFDPSTVHDSLIDRDQRGVMYWMDSESGEKRILTSKGDYLYALDADDGSLISSFGEGGWIHLGEGMDLEKRPSVSLNTPGQIYKDMFIIGANVGEDVPGAVRAFDIRTGDRRWIFHTLPRPGEFGSETWPEGYLEKTGGASNWSGLAIDTERGIVYSSTETSGPDFYGGNRYGENLFANSLVALDAHTGERIWHQQFVHHDMWDLDCPTPPTLLTVTHEGEKVDVVAQGTKMGLLFVFNRETGEPLWPIEERPTEPSRIDGIKSWPTQPFPTKPEPIIRQKYTENDISDISPRAAQITKDIFTKSGNYGPYPPPSLEQVIMFPGYDGGMEWGGSAADPDGILYVNVNEIPWYYQLIPTKKDDGSSFSYGESFYRISCASCHGIDRTGDPASGFPDLSNVTERYDRNIIKQFIINGGGRMPAFNHLSEFRQESIIDFLYGIEEPVNEYKEGEMDDDLQPYVFRGFERLSDHEGYPGIKPPWGTLNAVDLNTGEIKWKVPLGEYEELTERGVPQTGTENYGGPVVTAGGVIFIAASTDKKIRAFDKDTGKVLWEHELPFDGHSTPSTYSVDGKQYVVISAGGTKLGAVKGGMLVAFSLP